jgi:hypothetical protein
VPEQGLLEQPAFVVRPGEDRRLLAGPEGEVVGFARWQARGIWHAGPWSVLAVYEQEQAPLVFTVRRLFSLIPRHEVRDADGDLVGVLAGPWVLDRWQRPALRVQIRGAEGQILDERGGVLAHWMGSHLILAPLAWHDPFAKMLLLAAFLTAVRD